MLDNIAMMRRSKRLNAIEKEIRDITQVMKKQRNKMRDLRIEYDKTRAEIKTLRRGGKV